MVPMGECEHHPPGDGVCPTCLQRKLTRVWRGDVSKPTLRATAVDPALPTEALAVIGSIASIAKRTQHAKQASVGVDDGRHVSKAQRSRNPHPSFDGRDGGDTSVALKPVAAARDIEGVMKDWTALHAKRRSGQRMEEGMAVADASPIVEHSRASLPLVDRIAKETALRVILEVGDDGVSEEDLSSANRLSRDRIWEDDAVAKGVKQPERGAFAHHWHTRFRSKWAMGLASPLTTSSKVFPSKPVEKSPPPTIPSRGPRAKKEHQKTLRFDVEPIVIPTARVVFASETMIEGMPDEILKPEDMNQRLRTSYNTVLLWLQDLPSPQTSLFQSEPEEEDPALELEPGNDALYGEDLTLVGRLHEIAEEREEEEEVASTNHFSEVSSFGKFLIRAAQRHPREGLSRVASATPER